ncbi:BglII/BstYI family type II restriction endonuclease [Hyphomonas pacifica]|uniref:Uncharacterized protein n=1 Tax=Hyphomonas pacifica TaxID=1280941 RepID=A0A062U0V2_9PROT|nr:BglII/BstYI family type II restriction endonuclease [Hyphomonas pacifica]KCZ50239.1 hypothetical protein HY2_14855 [Hyphomonas pacifica]RAN32189.1 hypothetical protein HY3_15435 [Hyphomonas pacifica]
MFDKLTSKGFDISSNYHASSLLAEEFSVAHDEIEAVLDKFSIDAGELVAGGGGEASFTQRLRHALADAGWSKQNLLIEKRLIQYEGTLGNDNYNKKGERTIQSLSHEIDHVKSFESGTILLEIEWNNKDPFFDRDLENFKRLHADGAASLGVIITRGKSLQDRMSDIIEDYGLKHELDSAESLQAHGLAPTPRQLSMYAGLARRFEGNYTKAWAKAFVSDKYGSATTHWEKLADRLSRGVGNPCPLIAIGLPAGIIVP